MSSSSPHPQGCLICEGLAESSFNENNALTLSRLLGCPATVFSNLFQSTVYCPPCIHLIHDIGQIFADLQVLEEKLDDWKEHVEEQMKNSFEMANLTKNNEILPELKVEVTSCNQNIRERVISQLYQTSLTTFVRKWNIETFGDSTNLTDLDGIESLSVEATHVEPILSDLGNVFDDYLDDDFGNGPPSAAPSFRRGESVDEKIDISEASTGVDTDLTTDGNNTSNTSNTFGVAEQQTPLLELGGTTREKVIKQKLIPSSRLRPPPPRLTRIPCPFSQKCKVSISRNNNIRIDAHRLRYHEGVRKCYVCRTCGVGFAAYLPLELHQKNCHRNISKDESTSDVSSEIQITQVYSEPDISSNTESAASQLSADKSEITKSRFPIILLEKLKAEDIGARVYPYSRTKQRRTDDTRTKLNRPSSSNTGYQFQKTKSKRILTVKRCKIKINFLNEDDTDNGDILRSEIKDVPHFSHFKRKRNCVKIDENETEVKKVRKSTSVHKTRRLYTGTRIKCPMQGCFIRFKETEEHRRQAHVRHYHQGMKNGYRCDICDIYFRDLKDWKKHTSNKHTGIPAFVCKYCQKELPSQERLRYHILRVHEPHKIRFKCKVCKKIFVHKYLFDTHMRTHTKERPYMCEICSETFTSTQYLKYHQSKHAESPYKPYKCEYCGKQLSAPRSLRVHIKKLHTKEAELRCNLCDYGAHSKSELQRHFTSRHTDERNFKCTYCNKTYKVNHALTVHLRTHTGERPYKCKTCEKGFISSNYLNRHELIHSRAQCHTCEVCGKTFPVKNYLYIHMRSHNKTNRKRPTTARNVNPVSENVRNVDVTEAAPPNIDAANNEDKNEENGDHSTIRPTFPFADENIISDSVTQNPSLFLLNL